MMRLLLTLARSCFSSWLFPILFFGWIGIHTSVWILLRATSFDVLDFLSIRDIVTIPPAQLTNTWVLFWTGCFSVLVFMSETHTWLLAPNKKKWVTQVPGYWWKIPVSQLALISILLVVQLGLGVLLFWHKGAGLKLLVWLIGSLLHVSVMLAIISTLTGVGPAVTSLLLLMVLGQWTTLTHGFQANVSWLPLQLGVKFWYFLRHSPISWWDAVSTFIPAIILFIVYALLLKYFYSMKRPLVRP